MQKWLPDAFESDNLVGAGPVLVGEAFEKQEPAAGRCDDSIECRFRSESRFVDSQTLLGHLTRKERAELFELVEQDVARDYQEREDELRKQHQTAVQALDQQYRESLASLAAQLDAAVAGQLKEIAAAGARLAVQLAEKIVRKTIDLDPEVLLRALDTIQYKLLDETELHLSLNPEDAAWLEARPEVLEELGIAQIHADRRIEKGGCIVRAGAREWDGTIQRQLESLTEIVEEAIATAPDPGGILDGEDPGEPEVG